jgi:outer membrane protein OmpA-like peptidoglycan-associated protein
MLLAPSLLAKTPKPARLGDFAAGVTVIMAAWLLAISGVAWAQQDNLFASAESAREAAAAAGAELLSPRIFDRAVSELEEAIRDFSNGKSDERVRRKLAEAEDLFRKSVENAEIAALTLREEIESRSAAIAAEAERLVAEEFANAEEVFRDAVIAVEKGDLSAAQKNGEKANDAYRQAELNAIRTEHLAVARSLIAQARLAKTERTAPRTTAMAEDLLASADALLVANRYETAEAVDLARRAEYEARHAIYLGAVTEKVRDKEMTTEDVILEWESALLAVANVLEVEVDLSSGNASARNALVDHARELSDLREVVGDQNAHIAGLEEEIRELDARLGGAAADRDQLIRTVERQARVREQFDQIEEMFAPGEAIVLRDGNDIIIRLKGLRFASSSSAIDASFRPLLDKVDAAVDVFPQCNVTIEGHTDSVGDEMRNKELSEARARSVMSYMTEAMQIPAFRIRAAGYGDTRPIASNRTEQGRAQNRRIDIVITPKPDSLY